MRRIVRSHGAYAIVQSFTLTPPNDALAYANIPAFEPEGLNPGTLEAWLDVSVDA